MELSDICDPGTSLATAGRTRRLRSWFALATAVLILGTTSAVVAARAIAARDADRARAAFTTSAGQVASTLQLAIQHEEDLIFATAGFVAGNPTATKADFTRWATSVKALRRFPELLGVGEAIIVAQSGLAAYAARVAPGSAFNVTPPGVRPFYCFSGNGFSRPGLVVFPPDLDLCVGDAGTAGLAARDSGLGAYLPYQNGSTTLLVILTPVYRNGAPAATVTERRAAFLGWVGTEVLPKVILDQALAGHSGLAVTFAYARYSSKAAFHAGAAPNDAHGVTTDLHNGWTVRTFGTLPPAGTFANGIALTVLLGGIALSVLMAALLFVLATGRMRALSLVTEKTDELRHQALHDALTDLPNRALIMDRLEHLLARNLRDGKSGAAMYVDLDGFKTINDTLGHGAGDLLLEAVAERLKATLRDADTVGRMSGDEFIVLLDDTSAADAPELIAERLLDVIRAPFKLEGYPGPISITASVGIAVGHRESPEELLRAADLALYRAKSAGRNCYEVFQSDMGNALRHRHELELDLRAALDGDQFRLVYQPIYNLNDLAIVGVEALLRWDHPTIGQIEPDDFIPLLESTGQIVDVGRWVLRQACTQMAEWRGRGSDMTISVNVSGRQLDRDVVVDDVREALQLSGLDPAALTLEVAESVLMRHVDRNARRLWEIKELGVYVAIDDFGNGYSSLAHLHRLPVDCLKIDRSFIEAAVRSPQAASVVRTLVQLGKDLGLRTLAEGVETPAQIDYLRTQQVDQAQGFLMAKPLPPDALETQIFEPIRTIHPYTVDRA